MNNMLDWGDYRVVLLIAEAGSLSKAAKVSGSSHPTLFRKINAIEEKLGVRLFERFQTGYQPTAAGEEVVTVARQMEELAHDAERRVAGRDLRPSGIVRIATTDSLLSGLLGPLINSFRPIEPDIILEVVTANEMSDLSYREADIAIRPASPSDENLFGRVIGKINQGIYAAKSLGIQEQDLQNGTALPWIGPSRTMAYPAFHSWMKTRGYEASCSCRVNTVLGMYAVAQAGVGIALLPTYLVATGSNLEQIGPLVDEMRADLWLLTHPDLRQTARVRAVLDFFANCDLHLND